MYNRNITSNIAEACLDTPVIFINGARQVGKSTLVKTILPTSTHTKYVTLDDPTVLSAAKNDPLSFLQDLGEQCIIDEVQRAPELFLPIKKIIDEERKPGHFILTGSANILTLPKVSESLAGRMEIYTLWPLSQGEIRSHKEQFIDTVFMSSSLKNPSHITWEKICEMLLTGGFPEILKRETHRRQSQWFTSYISSIINRDIRDLSQIEGITELPRLLYLLANRAANVLSYSDISRLSGVPATTLKRYFALIESVFLVTILPAWFSNRDKRIAKAPKLYINDTGLLCSLLQIDLKNLINSRARTGSILENFVVMELMKQVTWSGIKPTLYHFRTQTGQEVDIVLEMPDGRIVGIEVKSSSSVSPSDFKGLKVLHEIAGKKFIRGIVLYTGDKKVTFENNMHALPIGSLWEY
jgi:predicted AAA+ superfamily ATPase